MPTLLKQRNPVIRKNAASRWNSVVTDWSLSNEAIAKQIHITKAYVSQLRHRLGKPAAPPRPLSHSRILRWKKYENADWFLRDIDLAKKFRITRERVRQIRISLKKPRSVYHHQQTKKITLVKWLAANREIIKELPLTLIARILTKNRIKVSHTNLIKELQNCKIPYFRSNINYKFLLMDWDISNINLEHIWETSYNSVANRRCRENLGKPVWNAAFGCYPKHKTYKNRIQNQKLLAAEYGLFISKKDWLGVASLLKEQSTANRFQKKLIEEVPSGK